MCILWKRTPFLMESGASCRAGNMNFLLLGCRSGFLGFMLLLLCEGTNAQLSHFSILEAVFQTLSSTRAERKFPRRSSSFLLKADSGRLLACSACWNLTEEGSGGGEEADDEVPSSEHFLFLELKLLMSFPSFWFDHVSLWETEPSSSADDGVF